MPARLSPGYVSNYASQGLAKKNRCIIPILLIQKVRLWTGNHLPSDAQLVSSRARLEASSVLRAQVPRSSKTQPQALTLPITLLPGQLTSREVAEDGLLPSEKS